MIELVTSEHNNNCVNLIEDHKIPLLHNRPVNDFCAFICLFLTCSLGQSLARNQLTVLATP